MKVTLLRKIYSRSNDILKIFYVGLFIGLFGFILPYQINSYIDSFERSTHIPFISGIAEGMFFLSFAVPLLVLIFVLAFIWIYRIFKVSGTKNYWYFLFCLILFLLIIAPMISETFIITELWFGFQSLYLYPIIFILHYLIFTKINFRIKGISFGTSSIIIWAIFSIILLLLTHSWK